MMGLLALLDSKWRHDLQDMLWTLLGIFAFQFAMNSLLAGFVASRFESNSANLTPQSMVKWDSRGFVNIPLDSIVRIWVVRDHNGEIQKLTVSTNRKEKHDFFAIAQLDVLLNHISQHLRPEQVVQRQARINWESPWVVATLVALMAMGFAAFYKWVPDGVSKFSWVYNLLLLVYLVFNRPLSRSNRGLRFLEWVFMGFMVLSVAPFVLELFAGR